MSKKVDGPILEEFQRKIQQCRNFAINLQDHPVEQLADSTIDLDNLTNNILPNASRILSNLENEDGSYILDVIGVCESRLKLAVNFFEPKFKIFKNSKTDYSYAQKALREYIENSKKIMSSSYENSQYDILQKMLSNQQACCKQLFPSMFKEEKIISVESAFIALAAPSFEGKTQSAFITDKMKPLYFSFVGCERSQSALPQPIYINFLNLSATLGRLADGNDLKDLVKSLNDKFESGLLSRPSPLIVDEIISTTFLLSRCRTFPFWSLGFLKALAEFMKKKSSEHPNIHWMELLAGDIEFEYAPVSIHDLESSECFKGLYIFLDEFKSESWSILLRNLAQAIGLKCVVANTSIKIIDFFGTNTSSSRRENGDDGWSIVFTKLNDANEEILNSDELRLDKSIEAIYEKFRDVRSLQNIADFGNDPIGKFLIALRVNMIRPGVCILFGKALLKFVEEKMPLLPPNFSLGILADFIAKSIADVLGDCKAGMVYKEDGKLAKMALSLTRSFENVSADIGLSQKRPDDFERDIQKLCNKVTYLTDHLFHLDNPQDENSDIFIAFRPSFILRENKLVVKRKNNEGSWTNARWELELSHFNQNDFCTLIGCLFVPIVDSVAYVLKKANLFNKSRPQGYGESKNENCASSDSGNELEVTVASILTESSRHPHENRVEFTFKGQRGIDFVRNIIRNSLLRITDSNDQEKNMNQFFIIEILRYSDKGGFDLKSFLQSCHFPFIYGWQKDGIQFFDQISNFAQDFYVQKLTRCANQQQIDCILPYKFERKQENGCVDYADFNLAIECKNYNESVDSSILQSIIGKALKHPQCNLCFIFANSFAETSKVLKIDLSKSKLTNFCEDNSVNVYRIAKIGHLKFEMVPFEAKMSICTNPKLVCIIFETDKINQQI